MRRHTATAVMLVATALLASCGDDDADPDPAQEHPHLLQPSDLPPVEKVTVREGWRPSKTNCAAMEVEYNLAITDDSDSYLVYSLDDGVSVSTAVRPKAMTQPTLDSTLAGVERLLNQCSQPDGVTFGTFERLEDLPDDAFGFRATQDTSNGPQTTERAYARVDDERAAVVTVVHIGEGEPPVTVEELLPKALERAAG